MSLAIRRAKLSDVRMVLELIRALAHFDRLPPPDDEALDRLVRDGWGDRPRFETWLATWEGQPVGYMTLFETYSTFLARPTLYIEDVFVLPEYRGRGIGRALFVRATQLASERGCGRMEWCCLDWNTNAQRFYEKLGARPLSEWIYYRLTAEQFKAVVPDGDLDAA